MGENDKSSQNRPLALITGASSGIGLELARILARNQYDLAIVARNKASLDKLATELAAQYQTHCRVISADLAQPDAPDQIFEQLRGVAVEVLINNAGFGMQGPVAKNDLEQQRQLLQVNIVALTRLTRLYLPGMVERRSGKILNVASTAAFQPGPYMACYYASKAYVLSFSEALWEELRKTGITVTALCPGATQTEFDKRAGMSESALFKGPTMTAAEVAEVGYNAMMRGKRVVIPGLRNRLMAWSVPFAPRSFVLRIAKKLNRIK